MNKPKTGYNTNLAAEFHVLSILYRKGVEAYLTLGNKKAVDIFVGGKTPVTIDVKGLAKKSNWLMNNFHKAYKNHYFVFVSFRGRIKEHSEAPECWIVPSLKVEKLLYRTPKGNRQAVQYGTLKKNAKDYQERWDLISALNR